MSKKNKRRHCPALGKEITSQECGADRQSRIPCTADCPFNTFNPENYDDFGDLESAVLAKARDRMVLSMTPERRNHFVERGIAAGKEVLRGHDLFQREFFRRWDSEGRNFFDRWAADGWTGLNNDERVYMGCHSRTKVALLQMQCVLGSPRLQAIDLLYPGREPFVIVDRTMARSARRFQTALSWVFPAPHYDRPCGAAIIIHPVGLFDELEVLMEIAKHLGGPAEVGGLLDWLRDHFVMVSEAMSAVMAARRADSLRLTDTKHGTATYRINGSFADLGEVLDEDADVEETDLMEGDVEEGFERRYDVFDRSAAGVILPQMAAMTGDVVLGSFRLGKKKIQAEAGSGARFVRLKSHLELVAGGRVTFLSEHIEDLGAQAAERSDGTWDPALVPPRLREEPQILLLQQSRVPLSQTGESEDGEAFGLRLARANISHYMDTSVPALNGLTPREAAADPAMRPALVRLMKGHVRAVDDMRYRKRLDVDINDQLAELGLHELIFPPPPLPEVAEEGEAEDEYDDDDPPVTARDLMAQFSPLERKIFSEPPPLRSVLSEADIFEKTEALLQEFGEPGSLLDYFHEEWPLLYDALDTVTGGTLNDDEFTLLTAMTGRAVVLLFPDGPPDTPVNVRRLTWYFANELKWLSRFDPAGPEGAVLRYVKDSPQPCLTLSLCGMLMVVVENKDSLLTDQAVLKMMPVLKAAVRELCQLPPP